MTLTRVKASASSVQTADRPNTNGRIYPEATLREAVEAWKTAGEPPVYGTIGGSGGLTVDLERVSHAVKNLRVEQGSLLADVEILDTPEGSALRETLRNCVFRPAGIGMVSSDGIVTDYRFISVDAIDKEKAA